MTREQRPDRSFDALPEYGDKGQHPNASCATVCWRLGRVRKYTAIDLFAGAGGLTLGLRRAHFRVIGAVEIDAAAAETFRRNHRTVRLWERDILSLSVAEVRRKLRLKPGQLDLLAGCPPCQGFSSMRTLNGRRRVIDPANDLLFQFLRFVRGLRPKLVMVENVPALAEKQRIRDFAKALRALRYTCEWRVVDAADYGVPQRRRRMIFVASRIGMPPPSTRTYARRDVRSAIKSLPPPGTSGDKLHDLPEHRAPHVQALIRHIPRDGGSRADAPRLFRLACHKRLDGFYDVYGRMAWRHTAPTITGGCHNPSKGRFLHPSQHRAITLREAALLQTFPRRYFFSMDRGKEHTALMIGNALPPRLIQRVATPLCKLLEQYTFDGR